MEWSAITERQERRTTLVHRHDPRLCQILDASLRLTIERWKESLPNHTDFSGQDSPADPENYGRRDFAQIVSICIDGGRQNPCVEVFQYFCVYWEQHHDTPGFVEHFVEPAVRDVREIAKEYSTPPAQDPFGYFFRRIIEKYFRDHLQPGTFPKDEVVSVGCGCIHCVEYLERFFGASDYSDMHIQGPQLLLVHLQGQVESIPELATFRTDFKHWKLEITKKPTQAQQEWTTSREWARRIMSSIGDEDAIRNIMVDDYDQISDRLGSGSEGKNLLEVTVA